MTMDNEEYLYNLIDCVIKTILGNNSIQKLFKIKLKISKNF
jgi:hypothetical protein